MGGKVTQFSRILPRTPVKIVVEPGYLAVEAVSVPGILEAVTGIPASRLRKTGRLTVFPVALSFPAGGACKGKDGVMCAYNGRMGVSLRRLGACLSAFCRFVTLLGCA